MSSKGLNPLTLKNYEIDIKNSDPLRISVDEFLIKDSLSALRLTCDY